MRRFRALIDLATRSRQEPSVTKNLSKEDALRAYAKTLNTLNIEPLEAILAPDFRYSSQQVLKDLTSKKAFLKYLKVKLRAVAKSQATVFAEMGKMPEYFGDESCVILAQHSRDNLVGLVIAEVHLNQLKGLHICIAPCPSSATRTGEYPR